MASLSPKDRAVFKAISDANSAAVNVTPTSAARSGRFKVSGKKIVVFDEYPRMGQSVFGGSEPYPEGLTQDQFVAWLKKFKFVQSK